MNRWLYHGLHSFDFPVFYYSRPLWDVVLVLLSIGGIALSVTTMLPAWRRVRRNVLGYSKVTIGRRMRSRINLSTQAARERS